MGIRCDTVIRKDNINLSKRCKLINLCMIYSCKRSYCIIRYLSTFQLHNQVYKYLFQCHSKYNPNYTKHIRCYFLQYKQHTQGNKSYTTLQFGLDSNRFHKYRDTMSHLRIQQYKKCIQNMKYKKRIQLNIVDITFHQSMFIEGIIANISPYIK